MADVNNEVSAAENIEVDITEDGKLIFDCGTSEQAWKLLSMICGEAQIVQDGAAESEGDD